MSYNARQLALFTDVASLYKPVHPAGASAIGIVKEPQYTLVSAFEPCKYYPNNESTHLSRIGRVPSGAKAELECFHFDCDVLVHDQWMLQLLTPGHILYFQWFIVIGDPEVRQRSGNRDANYMKFTVRNRPVAPTIV